MQRKKCVRRKILMVQVMIIAIFAMIFNMCVSPSYAYTVTHTQTKKTGINQFPDDYKSKLQELAKEHPNWNFTAFYTGMTWEEFMRGETGTHLRNRVHNSSQEAWKCGCNQSSGGYACASSEIIAYYADPRNFLTEDRNIPIYGNDI